MLPLDSALVGFLGLRLLTSLVVTGIEVETEEARAVGWVGAVEFKPTMPGLGMPWLGSVEDLIEVVVFGEFPFWLPVSLVAVVIRGLVKALEEVAVVGLMLSGGRLNVRVWLIVVLGTGEEGSFISFHTLEGARAGAGVEVVLLQEVGWFRMC
jgi:hypothetical protein